MFVLSLLSWWYGSGWAGVLAATQRRLRGLSDTFSVPTLLNTLFAPWRRIITYPGAGLDAKIRAFGDNLVSRCVGFTVRFFVLLAAAVSFIALCIAAVLELVIWPLVPLLAIGFIIWGLL